MLCTQAGRVLRYFFLHNFALKLPENLHHFFNLHNNCQFNVIWHGQSMATLIIYRRLLESGITVMPQSCVYGMIMLVV